MSDEPVEDEIRDGWDGRTIVIVRGRRSAEEAAIDLSVLRWVGRFRFVTAAEVSVRFGVSERKARKRLGRLAQAGVVVLDGSVVGVPRAVYLSRKGFAVAGLAVRRRPVRVGVGREHELALAGLVAEHEAAGRAGRVFTERDGRRRERVEGIAHSVQVVGAHGDDEARWPDLVIEHADGRRVAVELELSPKPTARLERILVGFLSSPAFDGLLVLADGPALAHRIAGIADRLGAVEDRRIVVECFGPASQLDLRL